MARLNVEDRVFNSMALRRFCHYAGLREHEAHGWLTLLWHGSQSEYAEAGTTEDIYLWCKCQSQEELQHLITNLVRAGFLIAKANGKFIIDGNDKQIAAIRKFKAGQINGGAATKRRFRDTNLGGGGAENEGCTALDCGADDEGCAALQTGAATEGCTALSGGAENEGCTALDCGADDEGCAALQTGAATEGCTALSGGAENEGCTAQSEVGEKEGSITTTITSTTTITRNEEVVHGAQTAPGGVAPVENPVETVDNAAAEPQMPIIPEAPAETPPAPPPKKPRPTLYPPDHHPLGRIWLAHFGNMVPLKQLSLERLRHCKARLDENPDEEYWVAVCKRMAAGKLCTGFGQSGWRADFDFFIRSTTHVRVMEGKYDGWQAPPSERNMTFADRRSQANMDLAARVARGEI